MTTYLDTLTGQRHIPYGVGSSVDVVNGVVTRLFIRGVGWKKVKKNQFKTEEIPDLPTYENRERAGPVQRDVKPDEYREYAKTYGAECAMHFLWCCDASKPSWHAEIVNPDPNRPGPVTQMKFRTLFGVDLFRFQDALLYLMHRWSFDILKFQAWLMTHTDYETFKDGGEASMEDYVKHKWGEEAAAFIEDLIDDKPRP